MKTFTLKELQSLTRNGIGLVVGPDFSSNPGHEQNLSKMLKILAKKKELETSNFLEISDIALESDNATSEVIRDMVQSHFATPHSASPDIYRLLPANFRAVISLSFDDHFKTKYLDHLESKPLGKQLATIACPTDRQSSDSLPYFALLGDPSDMAEDRRLVISESEYIERKAVWSTVLRSLPDSLLGDPLFFLGLNSCERRLGDFLTSLLAIGNRYPRKLIFLEGDPILENTTMSRILERKFAPHILTANLRDIGDAFSKETLSCTSLPLWRIDSKEIFSPDLLSRVDSRLSYVPRNDELQPNPDRRNKQLDSLFRPTHLDWEPYALGLPFKRDDNNKLTSLIADAQNKTTIRLVGDAAVGKTIMLRQSAFELSNSGYICFWFRRFVDSPSDRVYDELIGEFNSALKGKKEVTILLFLDDPVGTRVNEALLAEALKNGTFSWKLIICQRRSESAISSQIDFDYVFPNTFTDDELESFREYRSDLGIDLDLHSEQSHQISSGSAIAKDILCNLWYSLPQTKAALSEAISEEYDRLSGVDAIIEAYLSKEDQQTLNTAQSAYELVTVSSSFNIGLPVEVLVNSLGIPYEEWTEFCKEGDAIWGLLYDEDCPAIESWIYKTRNQVVTEVLMNHFNKGSNQNSFDYRALLRLVKACGSGSLPYRQFLIDLLISNRREIEKRFDLERAMELYETALEVYPRQLGKLEFHKIICKRNLGGDSLEVYDELTLLIERARANPADYDSQDKHLTSAAASALKAYKEKKMSGEDASEAIYRHTATAISLAPHSLHAVHTQANSLLKIGADIRSENSTKSVENVIHAANLIERSLMIIDEKSLQYDNEVRDYRLFSGLRDEYLTALPDTEDQEEELFGKFRESSSQVFLVMACRVALGKASKSRRGKDFKKAEDCMFNSFSLVESNNQSPDIDLVVCRVQLSFEWKLRQGFGPVDWKTFRTDISAIRSHRRFRDDPFWDFLLGVCAFHQQEFEVANRTFSIIRGKNLNRRFMSKRRCPFIGESKTVVTLEGNISRGANQKVYVYIPELGTDILGEASGFSEAQEEIKFIKIEFSMYGPLAIEVKK